MSKIITYSTWEANNIPNGVTFDSNLGVFSGTPHLPAGVYTVPVSVTTNYGSDNKDVTILVDEAIPAGDVYVISKGLTNDKAAIWSNNAPKDAYGFRKINIPKAKKLFSNSPSGSNSNSWFAAKTENGDVYVAAIYPTVTTGNYSYFGDVTLDFTTPAKFPRDNIIQMDGFSILSGSSAVQLFTYRLADSPNTMHIFQQNLHNGYDFYTYVDNIRKMYSVAGIRNDNSIFVTDADGAGNSDLSSEPIDSTVIDLALYYRNARIEPHLYYLTAEGNLFEFSSYGTIQLGADLGKIKKFWLVPDRSAPISKGSTQSVSGIFALTQDNTLFARGGSSYYMLGLPSTGDYYYDFCEVGSFDIKKMEAGTWEAVFLTHDGRLFHSGIGPRDTSGNPNPSFGGLKNSSFTHVFTDYRFSDFTIAGQHLITIRKESD